MYLSTNPRFWADLKEVDEITAYDGAVHKT